MEKKDALLEGSFENLGQPKSVSPRYLKEQLQHLEQLLQTNDYSIWEAGRAARPAESVLQETVGSLSYIHGIKDCIGRLLN